jgi:hypothetical protein
MGFKENYTTQKKIDEDESLDKVESKKTLLTPEGFAQGELLELLINTMRNK